MPILSKLWGYVIAAGALVLAVLTALGIARRSGVKAEREAQTEKALDQAKESNAIDKSVRADTDDALAAKLKKYQRD
jgi:hypothetical protein